MDAGNILKPALARGELHIVGATTLDEYRQSIEKDAALERRFQPVLVPEPSVEDTVAILHGLRDRYEAHHQVRFTDEALTAAAELSERYVTDRFLPDKAIDLVDQSGRAQAAAGQGSARRLARARAQARVAAARQGPGRRGRGLRAGRRRCATRSRRPSRSSRRPAPTVVPGRPACSR